MDAARQHVLDTPLLAAASRLTLAARRLVAGAVAGLHPSLHPGRAREFSQYRAYQPGDEPRHIDWKLFARSDRFFLRESEVDTRVAIELVLDASDSMQHRAAAESDARKFDRARAMAAAMALIAEGQGDPISLHVVSTDDVVSSPPVGHRQPFRQIVHQLVPLVPKGRWPRDPKRLVHALRRSRAHGGSVSQANTTRLTVILTDAHEHEGEIRASLAPVKAPHDELLFLHFLAQDELEFPYEGPVLLEEWETGRTLETHATAVRQHYLAAEQAHRRAWAVASVDPRFEYLPIPGNQPLERGLRALLRRRARH